MIFYVGTHVLSHAQHLRRAFISIARLRGRVSDFKANRWILDSGAFTEVSTYGTFRQPVAVYASEIDRWSHCGKLECAVSQDYMCEPFVLAKTGLTIRRHQELTIMRYDELTALTKVPILPVLQGYTAQEYIDHLLMYGSRLRKGMRVGVGSVCKRNGNRYAVVAVLSAIKAIRPDLRLHGFGLKTTTLADSLVDTLLYSADSMAWSFAARRHGGDRNGLREALGFARRIETTRGKRPSQLSMDGCQ